MNKTPTPRTDANNLGWQFDEQYGYFDSLSDTPMPWLDFAKMLEEELTTVTEQRDYYKLACDKYSEDEIVNTLQGLMGERDRLADRPSAPCSASSWLPIKELPNSLQTILITDGNAIWTDQKLGVRGDEVSGDYYFNGHEEWENVTHGMALPSLPNVKEHAPPLAGANSETGGTRRLERSCKFIG